MFASGFVVVTSLRGCSCVRTKAHLSDDETVAKMGTKLEVRGRNVKCAAIAHPINFDDPEKKKRTAA